ncbi:MAG: glucose-6-phosphate dehydrogenase assembly protein OpcA [Deltaproteobacteria bacterium]|nr:glucose-6-phosphate dehydrogenase assembly protein OpcA [Deltaproteobacteria bacterium]
MATASGVTIKAPTGAPQPEGTPLAGYAISVDVNGIEKELAALWRTQSKDKEHPLTRACAWNLVVQCGDEEAMTKAKVTADALVHAVPTRTILVMNNPYATTGKELEAWVSANCHVGAAGGKLLCTEEIHIESRGKGAELVPSLLRALVVPDVPTALWWAGRPPDNAAAVRVLVSGVDRLIVDSMQAPGGSLSKLAHVGGLLDGLVLVDMNWLRTATLRSLLASMFDQPVGPESLFKMRRMRLEVTEAGLPAAKLMLGWLISRLKWTVLERLPKATGRSWRMLSRDETPLGVDIDVVASSPRASGLHSLHFDTDDGRRFGFTAKEKSVLDVVGDRGTRDLSAAEQPIEQLMVAALGARGRDRLYAVALHRAMELER